MPNYTKGYLINKNNMQDKESNKTLPKYAKLYEKNKIK